MRALPVLFALVLLTACPTQHMSGSVTTTDGSGQSQTFQPDSCIASEQGVSATQSGTGEIEVVLGPGGVPNVVYVEPPGGHRLMATRALCSALTGTFTRAEGSHGPEVSGSVHIECASVDGVAIRADVTFDACH